MAKKHRGRYFWQTVEERLRGGDSITQVAATLGSSFDEIWNHFRSNPAFPRKYRFLIWLDREDDAIAKRRLEDYWTKIRATYTTKEGHSKETPTTLAMRWGVKPSLIIKMLKWDGLMDSLEERIMSKHTKGALLRGGIAGAGIGAGAGALHTLLRNRRIQKRKGKKHPKKSYVKGVLGGATIGAATGAAMTTSFNKDARKALLRKAKKRRYVKHVERAMDKNIDALAGVKRKSRYWKDREAEGFMPGVKIVKNLKKESLKESIQERASRIKTLRNARS
jgi:hypothetical protein